MKKYILIPILLLLISCVRNQPKIISKDEDIKIAEIDSSEIPGKIYPPSPPKKETVQKQIDTINVPSKYVVTIPLTVNKKKMDIRLLLSKSEYLSRGQKYTIVEIEENTNNFFPKSAYDCIVGSIELQHWNVIIKNSYYFTYDWYKNNGFKENDFVEKKKFIFGTGDYGFISIIDVDNDGYEDLLILDLSNSMRDNEVYQFYKWSQKQNKFIFRPDFFEKAAFFGWDKTGKYLITGISDTRERTLYKNKVVNGKLKVVDQCSEYAVSDKFCW